MKIFNTLTRQRVDFQPIEPGHVRLYVCGMTVYDFCHVGHARVLVVFDMVRRWFESQGYRVTYVRNITDIDDKIIARAVQNNEPIAALTDRFIQAMQQDAKALGVLPPTHEPRATAYVPQMLSMIDRLVDNGFAYQDANEQGEPGDVHFAVRQFPNYGALSGKSIDELRAGERVAVAKDKRDPLDFVLWKQAKADEPKDAVWSSGYGLGRPGWHIECSAMSCELLGPHFDIHGGGADLQFPHHENEIAQSEGAYRSQTHQSFVNTWMHNGFVRIDDEKMSKSLGNFFTIREVLEKFDPEVVRFFILRAHYRSPLNYSDAALEEARAGLMRLYTALDKGGLQDELSGGQEEALIQNALADAHDQVAAFRQAMDDDFNTPEAIAALFGLATEVNRLAAAGESQPAKALAHTLRGLACSLGLLARSASAAKRAGGQGQSSGSAGLNEDQIEALITERVQAKRTKDFARADGIRAELLAQGIVLEDGPAGTSWRRA